MSYIEITIWDKDGGRRRERTKAENNNSRNAIGLGSKVVNDIFDKVDRMTKGTNNENI